MHRFSRRSRAGIATLSTALLGLGGFATLASGPAAQASNNNFTCSASVLRVQGKGSLSSLHVEPFTANAANDPCKTSTDTPFLHVALPTGTGDHVDVITASTTDNEGATPDPNTASAQASVLDVQVGGTLLRASVLTSNANESQAVVAGCPNQPPPPPAPVNRSGDSHVARVVLNGTVIEVPTTKSTPSSPTLSLPVPAPIGPVNLFLREEITVPGNEGGSITERALELDTGLVNIVIAESRVDDAANSTAPPPGGCNECPPGSAEADPFVDPTADSTRGVHPDCAEFSEPKGDGDNTGRDYVHFDRSINDNDSSPNGSFTPVSTEDSRDRFYGDAGFEHDGDTTLTIEGKIYDDEDMHFRLAPLTIDAYFAPDDLAASPWRRFCGTGVIEPFEESSDGMDMTPPSAPFEAGQMRKWLIETFDKKMLDPDAPGGDQSDYFVIDIYAPGSDFDTHQCDPDPGGPADHEGQTLDYHSEGQTIAGNIEIHTNRVAEMS